jgi:hypothetical protein
MNHITIEGYRKRSGRRDQRSLNPQNTKIRKANKAVRIRKVVPGRLRFFKIIIARRTEMYTKKHMSEMSYGQSQGLLCHVTI